VTAALGCQQSLHNAEYEREDYQTPALLEVRILADSVSGQAGELAAALDGRVGGQERPRAVVGGQGRWGVAVIFLRTVGVAVQGDLADVVSGAKGVGRAGCLVAVARPATRSAIESGGITMAPLLSAATFERPGFGDGGADHPSAAASDRSSRYAGLSCRSAELL